MLCMCIGIKFIACMINIWRIVPATGILISYNVQIKTKKYIFFLIFTLEAVLLQRA
jgi:hypothetical protein